MRNLSTPEKRKLLRSHWKQFALQLERRERGELAPWEPLDIPDFPRELCGLDCGARTRAGTQCKRHDISLRNGRCRLHGGESTGPRTKRGKKRSALNGLRPKVRKRTP